jgi:hypothetical protein
VDTREGRLAKGNEMRAVLAALVALTVLYFVDKDFNHGNLLDGLDGCCEPFPAACFIDARDHASTLTRMDPGVLKLADHRWRAPTVPAVDLLVANEGLGDSPLSRPQPP